MAQAPLEHGFSFDLLSLFQDLLIAPEVDIGGRQVSEALVVALVVVMVDEGGDLPFQVARQEVMFEQDAVLHGLVPALDLALGLGMIGRAADMLHALFLDVIPEGARVIQIPHRAPDANAFAESFIGTIKRECLDFFVCFSRSQLDYSLRTWVRHYNVERPHRGRDIGNNVLQVDFRPVRDGPIRRKRQLGGIIISYTPDAA